MSFDTIGTIEAPVPQTPPSQRRRGGGRIVRLVRVVMSAFMWYREHCTPVWCVVRTLRVNPEHTHHMSVGLTAKVVWEHGTDHAVLTWKWNANRLANRLHWQTGEIYEYTIKRLK